MTSRRNRLVASLIAVGGFAAAGLAFGAPDPAMTLALQVRQAMAGAQRWAEASAFPPDYTVIEIARYGLIAIDAADLPHDVEVRALDRIQADHPSPAQLQAVQILREEISHD